MDKECFNMVVRVNATDEARLFMDTNDHIFDLRFSVSIHDKIHLTLLWKCPVLSNNSNNSYSHLRL
jgi:hypothetical protein